MPDDEVKMICLHLKGELMVKLNEAHETKNPSIYWWRWKLQWLNCTAQREAQAVG